MADWFKKTTKKTGKNSSTTTTKSSKGTRTTHTTKSSLGGNNTRTRSTSYKDGKLRQTVTDKIDGRTKRTSKTLGSKVKKSRGSRRSKKGDDLIFSLFVWLIMLPFRILWWILKKLFGRS